MVGEEGGKLREEGLVKGGMGGEVMGFDKRVKEEEGGLAESAVGFSEERTKKSNEFGDDGGKREGEGGDGEGDEGPNSSQANNFIFQSREKKRKRRRKLRRKTISQSSQNNSHTFNRTFFHFTINFSIF